MSAGVALFFVLGVVFVVFLLLLLGSGVDVWGLLWGVVSAWAWAG